MIINCAWDGSVNDCLTQGYEISEGQLSERKLYISKWMNQFVVRKIDDDK